MKLTLSDITCCSATGQLSRVWIALAGASLLLGSCMSLQLGRPLAPEPEDWLTTGGSSERQHYVDDSLSFPLVEKWRYNAHGGFGPGSPLVAEETIFVGARNGQIHGLRLSDGDRRGREEFGEAIEGTAVVTDSTIYIPVSWETPQIIAYDLTRGKIRWRRSGTAVETGLAIGNGLVYAADVKGRVTAFHRATGDTAWTSPSDSLVSYRASPVISEGRVLVVDDRGRARALDARTGAVEWQTPLGGPVDRTPAVFGSTVYVPSARGSLWAVDARQGTVKWTFKTSERPRRLTAPAVNGNVLVVAGSDGMVRRINASDGTVEWTRRVGGPVSAAPLLLRNALVVGSMDTYLYALDLVDGGVRWKTQVEGRIKSAPTMKDRHLIVLAEPSHVYAFVPKAAESVAASVDTDHR